MRFTVALLLMISLCCQASGLAMKKTAEAVRTNASVKIDGVLDEDAWNKAIPVGRQDYRPFSLPVCIES